MLDILELGLLAAVIWKLFLADRVTKPKNGRQAILDTCALIDGRVIELANSGFLPETLVIPEFILHELQLLADGTDAHKRERARYGLDVAHQLQDTQELNVVIDREQIPEKAQIDDKLVALAKKRSAWLYTTDYNLGKIAAVEQVRVLNVNELAGNLRPVALPGEDRVVKILQKGSNPNQGVAYMEDGTMIVVENAAKFVGKNVKVSVIRMHQTVAGKMIFAEIVGAPAPSAKTPPTSRTRVLFKRPRRGLTKSKPTVL